MFTENVYMVGSANPSSDLITIMTFDGGSCKLITKGSSEEISDYLSENLPDNLEERRVRTFLPCRKCQKKACFKKSSYQNITIMGWEIIKTAKEKITQAVGRESSEEYDE